MSAVDIGAWRASGAELGRARRISLSVCGVVLVVAGAYAATLVATEGEPLLAVPLVGALVTLAVLTRPLLGLYLLFAAAIVFEQWPVAGIEPLTAQTHFYENLSQFSDAPLRLSAADVLALLTFVSWLLRRAVGANAPARAGPFGWGVAAYLLAFVLGTIIGVSRGGKWDLLATLNEVRGPVYVCLLYFLTVNLVRTRAQLMVVVWEFVLLVGLKAFQAIGNYAQMLSGPERLEAVTAHEDVIFFDVAIALAVVMALLHVRGKLFYVVLALQPVVFVAELVTTRRVAFAALAAALAVVAFMSAVERPRATALALGIGVLAFGIYAASFWDQTGPLAEPARVLREVVDPYSISDRDRSSNVWRDIENANIAYTVRQLPLTGVGAGQEYLFQREPPQGPGTFLYWRLTTHNAVLWTWLKAGPYGAFAFWFLVGQVVAFGLRLYRRLDDPLLRAAAAFPALLTVTQVVFSSFDLGLTYSRTMIVLGVTLGLAAPLAVWSSERAPRQPSPVMVGRSSLAGDGARVRRLPTVSG
ncbi:MAG: hypothetical protein AUH33_03080 [Chloroflexi bacterium 13_1_40CM_68_21]|nr:MAG: hypothetical protein AUH33_03080 [Chloroflexi bacterium 13_1_40CM_68_21]